MIFFFNLTKIYECYEQKRYVVFSVSFGFGVLFFLQMSDGHLRSYFQFLLTMKYLSEMTEEQTLVMYSGHPAGLFPSSPSAPRVVVTNGMV